MAKRVIVVPYSEQWKADFETIKQYVLPAINDVVIGIEHIGSTSVDGLSAKPIIDIDIVIKDYSVFDAVVEKLASFLPVFTSKKSDSFFISLSSLRLSTNHCL